MSLPVTSPIFTVSVSSPAHTRHLVASPADAPPLIRRSAYAYATQEQFRRHSAAHSSRFLLPTRRNPSGDFVPGMARKPSPHRGASSFRRQPFEKLPRLHSSALAGSKPSRHLHAGAAPPPAVPSQ